MPYLTKTASTLLTHPGETVNYTYTFYNDDILPHTLTQVEDDYFGIVWSGAQVVLPGGNFAVTHDNISDCTTITNRARAYYL